MILLINHFWLMHWAHTYVLFRSFFFLFFYKNLKKILTCYIILNGSIKLEQGEQI